MMEKIFSNFHTSFLIPDVQKLAFHVTHVQILDTIHCGDSRRTGFKRCESFKYLLCCSDYNKRVVASSDHQIQP